MIVNNLIRVFNIKNGLEHFDCMYTTIENDIVFKGERLWILMLAIVLASVGLNTNSTAVIIGAMLISPLMGPINGMGFSIAIHDFILFRKAAKNLTFAIIASLITSTLYFAISPVSTAHSELLSRTSPTIYDVLIALFGGFAGTISLTTKLKGNIVPGVAIATALMPPLCTAGYGLATAQFTFFFGAIYLFTINMVFIGLSTLIFSQVMSFPIKNTLNAIEKKRINNIITGIIIITIIPSIYFGYILVQKEKFIENSTRFIRSVSFFRGEYLLQHEVDAKNRSISLIYGGRELSENDKLQLRNSAKEFGLTKATLNFKQGINFDDFSRKLSETENLKAEINRLSFLLQKNVQQQDSLQKRSYGGKNLLHELNILFPTITTCLFAEPYRFSTENPDQPVRMPYVIISLSQKNITKKEKEKIIEWLKTRLQNDQLKVIFE